MDFYLYRPAMAQPPLCTWLEVEKINLRQLMDMHEALDLRTAAAEKAALRAATKGM